MEQNFPTSSVPSAPVDSPRRPRPQHTARPQRRLTQRICLSAAAVALILGATACSKEGPSASGVRTSQSAGITTPIGNPALINGAIRTINVHGTGIVTATPDKVIVTLGVETRSTTAAKALEENSAKAAELSKLLKGNGVAEKDLQTSNLSINPEYDPTGKRIQRYIVNNSVTATLRDIDGAGALINAAATVAGDAIRVNSLQFGVSEVGPAKDKARVAAVEDARKQAEQLAGAAGVKLGKLRVIQSSSSTMNPPIAFDLAERSVAQPVPLAPGSQEISVEVDLAFDIEG